MRRFVLPLCALLALALAPLVARAEPPINTNDSAYAIGGFDVVAYFNDGQPEAGKPQHAAHYAGATWLFATSEHKALFESSPAKYVPAYRGYCAYGVSRGSLVKVDPAAFTIRNGTLYLNKSLSIRAKWLTDPETYITQANANWPKL